MDNLSNLMRVLFIFLLFLSSFLVHSRVSFIPDPPNLNAENYLLIDHRTQRILAEKGADERIEPASITKLMTGYVVADQINKGFIGLEDDVLVSENCWKKVGSRMFIEAGKKVSVEDLLKGMVIQSGNDATCQLAEHIAGSEEGFIDLMQSYVQDLELKDTNFINSSGWPDNNHYSTARDLAKLSSRLISDYPDHYDLYKEKWFIFNGIKQRNRNSLLWQDDSIDGIKTGHTESAGYCLVSSAEREQTRLIALTFKSDNERTRITDNRRLLDYGFRYYKTRKILTSGQIVIRESVWGGEEEYLGLSVKDDIFLTQNPRDFDKINVVTHLDDYLQAPVLEGDRVGDVILELDGETLYRGDLVAGSTVLSKGIINRVWSSLQLFIYSFLMEDEEKKD